MVILPPDKPPRLVSFQLAKPPQRPFMAPKILSTTFFSSLTLPNHHRLTETRFATIHGRAIPAISCKSTRYEAPSPETRRFESKREAEGTGAASPTRGDQFLERQKAMESAKLMMKQMKKKDKIRKVKALKLTTEVSSCYGCGAPLQTSESDSPGYVDPDAYDLVQQWR